MLCSVEDELLQYDFKQDYSQYENMIFNTFTKLYCETKNNFRGKPIYPKKYPPGYDEKSGFYHMACRNYFNTYDERDRKPDLNRCARIHWPSKILNECIDLCEKVMIWENERKGKRNTVIYCLDINYVIVLGHRKNYLLLITAYPVDEEHSRKKLLNVY